MNQIIDFFLTQPRRLLALSQAFVATGGFVLLAGTMGWALMRMMGVVQQRAPAAGVPDSLATLYPMWWTWWVPETLIGAVPALALVGLGFWLRNLAGKLLRLYRR
jgi:hypothetical protein